MLSPGGVHRLWLYELRFREVATLTRAFDRVSGDARVGSCSIELAARRVRILAEENVAESLIERLYLEGGLAWCSRHPCEAPAGAASSRAP